MQNSGQWKLESVRDGDGMDKKKAGLDQCALYAGVEKKSHKATLICIVNAC